MIIYGPTRNDGTLTHRDVEKHILSKKRGHIIILIHWPIYILHTHYLQLPNDTYYNRNILVLFVLIKNQIFH